MIARAKRWHGCHLPARKLPPTLPSAAAPHFGLTCCGTRKASRTPGSASSTTRPRCRRVPTPPPMPPALSTRRRAIHRGRGRLQVRGIPRHVGQDRGVGKARGAVRRAGHKATRPNTPGIFKGYSHFVNALALVATSANKSQACLLRHQTALDHFEQTGATEYMARSLRLGSRLLRLTGDRDELLAELPDRKGGACCWRTRRKTAPRPARSWPRQSRWCGRRTIKGARATSANLRRGWARPKFRWLNTGLILGGDVAPVDSPKRGLGAPPGAPPMAHSPARGGKDQGKPSRRTFTGPMPFIPRAAQLLNWSFWRQRPRPTDSRWRGPTGLCILHRFSTGLGATYS